MAMSRKDYNKVAEILATANINADHEAATNTLMNVASDLALYFKQDNARFDRSRFLTACGVAFDPVLDRWM